VRASAAAARWRARLRYVAHRVAARVLQRWYVRASEARRALIEAEAYLLRAHEAATRAQRWWRGWLVRRVFEQLGRRSALELIINEGLSLVAILERQARLSRSFLVSPTMKPSPTKRARLARTPPALERVLFTSFLAENSPRRSGPPV